MKSNNGNKQYVSLVIGGLLMGLGVANFCHIVFKKEASGLIVTLLIVITIVVYLIILYRYDSR